MTPITIANFEEFLMLRLDGELTAAEAVALDRFLAAHPELAGTAAAYEITRLTPDLQVLFGGKEALLQPETAAPVRRRIALLPWSLAAAAVLLIAVGIRMLEKPENQRQQPVAHVKPVKSVATPVLPVLRTPVQQQALPVAKRRNQLRPPVETAPVASPAPVFGPALPQEKSSDIARLEPLPAALYTADQGEPDSPPEYVAVTVNPVYEPEDNSILHRLPLGSERSEVLLSLKASAKESLQRVRAVRRNLKNTEATFALAGRELFTLRF